MARSRDKTVEAYAVAAHRLIQQWISDPSAEQIAAEFIGGAVIPDAVMVDVRRKLRRIRDVMVTDEPFRCAELHLVNRTYYRRYRGCPPDTDTEARLCLPIGAGNVAEGLRLTTTTDDRIWLASLMLAFNQGAGRTRKSQIAVIGGWDRGRLSDVRTSEELLRGAHRLALPQQIAAKAQQLMLPPPEAT